VHLLPPDHVVHNRFDHQRRDDQQAGQRKVGEHEGGDQLAVRDEEGEQPQHGMLGVVCCC